MGAADAVRTVTLLAIGAALSGWLLPATTCAAQDDIETVTVQSERSELQDSGVVVRVPSDPLGASSVAEMLATLPGVQIRSSGGLGSYSEASLRGSSARQVQVLLDGMPLDTGGGEATSLSLISPLLLDEVDVYKGRVPLSLGSGLAGTINLRSRRELAAPLVAAATVGSFGQRQLDLAAQLAPEAQLALGTQAADNDFRYDNAYQAFDPGNPDRSKTESRRNAQTAQSYGLLRYRGPLTLTAHWFDDRQHLPTRMNTPSEAELLTRSYALAADSPLDAPWPIALSYRLSRENFRDPGSQIGLGAQDSVATTQRGLLSVGHRASIWENRIGAEYTLYSAEDRDGELATADARRMALSHGFAIQSPAQNESRWRYNANLQAGWSRDDSDGQKRQDWRLDPAVGANRSFSDCLIAANLGHRQRLPTFFERYGDRGLYRGNPALNPESANYADLGARCAPQTGRLRRFELSLFGQDLHDAISPVYSAQGVGHSVNTDRALIYGLELDSAAHYAGLSWQLDGTWQHSEDLSDTRASHGQQLPGRFDIQLNLRVEKSWDRLTAYYAFRYEAGQYYDSANNNEAPIQRRHDLGLRTQLGRLGCSLQVLNLGNENFAQFNGYPTPGRRWQLSLSYPQTASAPSAPSP